MQEGTIYIGKRYYNSEREALRALKKQERRINKKMKKHESEWAKGHRNGGLCFTVAY